MVVALVALGLIHFPAGFICSMLAGLRLRPLRHLL